MKSVKFCTSFLEKITFPTESLMTTFMTLRWSDVILYCSGNRVRLKRWITTDSKTILTYWVIVVRNEKSLMTSSKWCSKWWPLCYVGWNRSVWWRELRIRKKSSTCLCLKASWLVRHSIFQCGQLGSGKYVSTCWRVKRFSKRVLNIKEPCVRWIVSIF